MGDKPFIKFYPSDFLGGTSGLSPAERGVYMTILCLIYEQDGPIRRDDSRLSRRCGAPKAAFVRILEDLKDQSKITETDGMLFNNRAEKAIVDRTNRTQIATHAANQRWNAQSKKINKKQRQNDAGAMPGQCTGDASQSPEPDIRDTNVSLSTSDFEDFWSQYPRKIGKGAAFKSYEKAVKKADKGLLLSGVMRYAQECETKETQFIAHPSTWLNQERWNDEYRPDPDQQSSNDRNGGDFIRQATDVIGNPEAYGLDFGEG